MVFEQVNYLQMTEVTLPGTKKMFVFTTTKTDTRLNTLFSLTKIQLTQAIFNFFLTRDQYYSRFSQVSALTVGCTDIFRDASTTLVGLPS